MVNKPNVSGMSVRAFVAEIVLMVTRSDLNRPRPFSSSSLSLSLSLSSRSVDLFSFRNEFKMIKNICRHKYAELININ